MKIAVRILSLVVVSLLASTSFASTNASTIDTNLLDEINSRPISPELYKATLSKLVDKSYLNAFTKSVDLELNHHYKESIDHLLVLQKAFPEAPYIMWRLAREYWVYAENMDIDDKENRLINFGIGLDWATKGIKTDPECAQCYMYKFANLGRVSTTKGLMNSISSAKELSDTIAKTIALKPEHRDSEHNYSLANAYYASGVFYRIIPDWFIIKWIAGVRGDKMLALEHIKKAAELTPQRIDYQVELGAIYLCLAEDKGKEELRPLGNETLTKALDMVEVMPTDKLDKEYAKGFLESARGACGFSRDGIVDLDKKKLSEKG